MTGRSVAILKSITFILCFVPILAEEEFDARELLRDVDGFRVIASASYVVKEKGLTEEQLQTSIEKWLGMARIKVVKDKVFSKDAVLEYQVSLTTPHLILLVNGSRITLRVAVMFIEPEQLAEIVNEVTSEEITFDFMSGRAFSKGAYSIAWERQLDVIHKTEEELFSHVSRLVEEFIEDYRSVNPRLWVVWEDYAALTNPFVPTMRSASD